MIRNLLFIWLACTSISFAKGTWDEQQAWAENQTAEYVVRCPAVRSDLFAVKRIDLPVGGALELDLRIERPQTGGPFPVIFYVHGGAWATGSKAHFAHQSFELAKHGIAGVRIEYRWKSQGGMFPNVIGDVLDAIDFVRQRQDELNLDFTRVGLAGGSAGGHLSAIAAQLTPECICYDGYNGLYDVLDRGYSHFGGGDFTGTTDREKKKASALYLLQDNPPDTFLYHGTEDTTIDIDQAHRFAEAIRKKGASAEVLVYEGVGHSFFGKEPYLTATTRALLDHTSYVFGLTEQKPVLSEYELPPKIAKVPDAFTMIGKWRQKDAPSKVYEFKDGFAAVSPSGEALKWDESFGNYYIVWGSGHYNQIDILNAKTFQVGKQVYVKEIEE